MASLFKLRITRYVDKNGRRVRKGMPGARVVRVKSRKWYGEYRDLHGKLHRVALASDKSAAQARLTDLIRKMERDAAGLVDPYEQHLRRSLAEHLDDYEGFLAAKGSSAKHVRQTIERIRKVLVDGCGFKRLCNVEAPAVAIWLAQERESSKKFSAQTSNAYLNGAKYFLAWLVAHERLIRNPLAKLKPISTDGDRRHDRRSLSDDEFRRLVEAAQCGPPIERVHGTERAMLYVLAAWTGYRRRELASLTVRSFDLDSDTPSVRVEAAYSKRRREDTVPLHTYVAERLKRWLDGRDEIRPGAVLFALRTPKGDLRRTSKMMERDLGSARKKWLDEAQDPEERERREKSDYLRYCNEEGLFADFHANRHTFISNLSRAGVPLAVAQKLARHSDPRLTASRYTHVELGEQAAAIATLPGPADYSGVRPRHGEPQGTPLAASETLVAVMVAGASGFWCQQTALAVSTPSDVFSAWCLPKYHQHNDFVTDGRRMTPPVELRPAGLEPATCGLEVRCSIHLSYGRPPDHTTAVCLGDRVVAVVRRSVFASARTVDDTSVCVAPASRPPPATRRGLRRVPYVIPLFTAWLTPGPTAAKLATLIELRQQVWTLL